MFNNKKTLQSTLAKVNQFIDDLKSGVEAHEQEVDSIDNEINALREEKQGLQNQISQATKLIGTLSGNNN